jgi:Cytochrome b(C-terminal)/b6/petD
MSTKDFVTGMDSNARKSPRRVAFITRRTSAQVKLADEETLQTFPEVLFRAAIAIEVMAIGLVTTALLFNAPLEGIADPSHTPNPAKAPWYFLGLQELLHYFPPVVAGVVLPGLVVLSLVVIPYARINLTAGPLWPPAGGKRTAPALAAATAALFALFAVFRCWPIAVPTLLTGGAMFAARGGEKAGRFRRALQRVTLPEWIMTWFVVIASLLTVIGTFFRGPGWAFVWPWSGTI